MLQAEVQNGADFSQCILFAEDDIGIGCIVTEMLRDQGFNVTLAESGDAAATILDTGKFHLLLTDVRMPGIKDGIDSAIHARQQNPQLPVVIVSGYAEGLGLRLKNLRGNTTFLSKPFPMKDLVNVIRSGLAPQSRIWRLISIIRAVPIIG